MVIYERKTRKYLSNQKEQEILKQREVFEAINQGEEKERLRIAQDLHDGIGAKLSGIKMQLEYAFQNNIHDDVLTNNLIQELDETIIEVREISHNLQPYIVSIKGLRKTLEDFILHLNRKNKCHFELYIELNDYKPRIEIQVCIYRVVYELLINVLKHSNAHSSSLQILVFDKQLQIVCEDDGKGFMKDNHTNGIGLLNIQNRISQLHGELNIDSSSSGTSIIIQIPIKE